VAHQVFRSIFALDPALRPNWPTSGVVPYLMPEPPPPARPALPHPPPRAGSQTEAPPGRLPSPLNNLAPRRLLSLLHSLKWPTSKCTPRPPSSSSDRLPPPLSSTIKDTPSTAATRLTSHSPFLLSSALCLLSHRARSAAAWSHRRPAASSLPSTLHSIGEVPCDLLVS
jgi:hypothetical protein